MTRLLKIGLGTVQYGTRYGISNSRGQTPPKEVSEILAYANDVGITTLDTASAYGNAEAVLGDNDLSSFRIVSKFLCSNYPLEVQVRKSLSDLKVEQLHGYLAHRPADVINNPDIWEELLKLKRAGVIRNAGFSFNSPLELEQALSLGLTPDLIQVPYNYFDRRFDPYFQRLKALGCEVHTRSAFLQGLFFMHPDSLPDFFRSVKQTINNLQQAYQESLSSLLLKFVHEHSSIDCVIVGSENVEQLTQNLRFQNMTLSLPAMNETISDDVLMPMNWPKK